jgi:hypothetical protein
MKIAKKRIQPGGSQPALSNEWVDQIPEVVQEAADSYLRAMRQKNKFTEQTRNAREKCIELMKEHKIPRMRIDDGKQWLECEDVAKLQTRKVKTEQDDTRQSARA